MTEQPISGRDIFIAASQAHDDFLNAPLIVLFSWGKNGKVIEKLSDYIAKCDVPDKTLPK